MEAEKSTTFPGRVRTPNRCGFICRSASQKNFMVYCHVTILHGEVHGKFLISLVIPLLL